MARGVNKCHFIGNLTRDPEVKYMPSGKAVASFAIAVNESRKDKDGNKQERVEYVNISMFGKLAEIAGQYLTKGAPVYVEGKLHTEKFQDKQTGQDRYSTKIIADDMQMLGGGGQRSSDGQAPKGKPSQPAQREPGDDFDDFSDDIAF